MKWLLGIGIVIATGLLVLVGIVVAILPPVTPMDEARMFELVNEQRELKGLAPLVYDETLEQATEKRAKGLCNEALSHDNFIPELEASKYNYTKAGENLAEGYYGSERTVQAWVDSPTHYKNIVGDYTETGMAIVNCGHKTVTVQWFGKE